MNIASIYGFSAFPPKGGNHVHALQLIRQFTDRGHRVITWGDDSIPNVSHFPRTRAGGEALLALADVVYLRVDANHMSEDPLLVRLLEDCRKPLVWEINAPANEGLAFSWLGGDRAPGGLVLGLLDRLRRTIHASRKLKVIVQEEALRRRLAQRASAAVCVSGALVRYAKEGLGIANAVSIPNGADHQAIGPAGNRKPLPEGFLGCLTAVYAGSPMYPWQGLDVLRQTIELCHAAGDPVRFVLLMNQPPARSFELPNTVCHIRVPHDEVPDYVRSVDVGLAIHPEYFWSDWGFHGSPMKMFDYMACGKPVVGSNVGQLAELIQTGRNGVLFDNTPEGLRSRLLELHTGVYDVTRMGLEARREVEEQFNWQAIAAKTLEIMEQVVREPAR